MSTNEGPGGDVKYDITQHVEHLRTIHFSLLVTCVALFIAIQFLPNRTHFSALRQIKKLNHDVVPKLNDAYVATFADEVAQEVRSLSEEPDGLGSHQRVIQLRRSLLPEGKDDKKYGYAIQKNYSKIDFWTPISTTTNKPAEFTGGESYCCLLQLIHESRESKFDVYIKGVSAKPTYVGQKNIPSVGDGTIDDAAKSWAVLVEHKALDVPWAWDLVVSKMVPTGMEARVLYTGERSGNKLYLVVNTTSNLLVGTGVLDSPTNQNQIAEFQVKATYEVVNVRVNVDFGKYLSEKDNNNFELAFSDLHKVRSEFDNRRGA
jgi:hypothetical protein